LRSLALLTIALLLAACGSDTTSTAPSAVSTPQASASASASVGPEATTIGGLDVIVTHLGPNTAPIDVTYAFGSIWTANHRDNSLSRLDPATGAETERITVGSGPGWFVATDDALWVSNQNGRGLTRIDPSTGAVEIGIGQWPPCNAPVLAFDRIWQPSCDTDRIMRLDPKSRTQMDIAADGRNEVAWAGGTLVAVGPSGPARLDPTGGTFNELAPMNGDIIGADRQTVWMTDGSTVTRLDPKDGKSISTLQIPTATLVRVGAERAWLLKDDGSVLELDPATGATRRTILLDQATSVVEAAGALWVTAFDRDSVVRIPLT
jgi:YVTN family beta-propeller protein